MIYQDIELLPQNLSKLGVERKVGRPQADLLTIWDTTYPIITNYKILCAEFGISPFGGGNYLSQGPESSLGFVTSGYRLSNGPHGFGFAIDIHIWSLDEQIRWIKRAIEMRLFTRAGFYPHHDIIHLDIASRNWMIKYSGRRFWVCQKIIGKGGKERKYKSFDYLNESIDYAKNVPVWNLIKEN